MVRRLLLLLTCSEIASLRCELKINSRTRPFRKCENISVIDNENRTLLVSPTQQDDQNCTLNSRKYFDGMEEIREEAATKNSAGWERLHFHYSVVLNKINQCLLHCIFGMVGEI